MKSIMKNNVNRLYELLVLKEEDPVEYESKIQFGERCTARWDEPEIRASVPPSRQIAGRASEDSDQEPH